MNTLPVEIFAEILGYLPPAACKSARLTSRQFNAVLARTTFGRLRAFLDPEAAQAALRATLRDLGGYRPRALWSPNCSVPDGLPLPPSFLRAVSGGGDSSGEPWLRGPNRRRRPLMLADSSDESSSDDDGSELRLAFGLPEEEEEEEEKGPSMGTAAMLQQLGRPEIDEQMLRQALFRYALYKSYVYDGEGEAPQLWVMNSTTWKYQV
ncbi:Cyclin-like F-box [Cordyceps javanica]|uniref:Cyclin-like F-box n=1 Tax=Cordyceps javanica TaxID=43265 RepID=A0A545URB6_9HYPO|nr:Cyclin-like F-box [Cordyceps javanica]